MDIHFPGSHTLAGMVGGTMFVLLQAGQQGIWHAAMMAALGAAISFLVSMLLKGIAARVSRIINYFLSSIKNNNQQHGKNQ
ncbi:MAG: hypothetical protein JWQ27_2978 [Ferruginibacter sp.]|nr:hypothetical protein [Ferruginibacter sp.]